MIGKVHRLKALPILSSYQDSSFRPSLGVFNSGPVFALHDVALWVLALSVHFASLCTSAHCGLVRPTPVEGHSAWNALACSFG